MSAWCAMAAAINGEEYEPVYFKKVEQRQKEADLEDAWNKLDSKFWSIQKFIDKMSDFAEYTDSSSDEGKIFYTYDEAFKLRELKIF